jgi:hypothetical protein
MLEHAWVYNYTEDDEIGGHCSRCGISDGTSPMPDCISEAEAKLRRLPADWEKDSSLETWFPLTAEELKRTNAENVWLKSWIKAAKQFAWAHETGCARGTSEGACTCGLDQFLGRSKMFVESYQAEVARLKQLEVENAALREAHSELRGRYENLLGQQSAIEVRSKASEEYCQRCSSELAELRKDKERLDWLGEKYDAANGRGTYRKFVDSAMSRSTKPKSAADIAREHGIAGPTKESQEESMAQETGL